MQIFELHNRATIDIIWILKKMSNFFAKVSNSALIQRAVHIVKNLAYIMKIALKMCVKNY